MLCVISLSASCSFDRDYDFKKVELVIAMTRPIIRQRNHALRFDRRTLPVDYTAFFHKSCEKSQSLWRYAVPQLMVAPTAAKLSRARVCSEVGCPTIHFKPIRKLPCTTHSKCTKSRLKLSTKLASGARIISDFFRFAHWKHKKLSIYSHFANIGPPAGHAVFFAEQNDTAHQIFLIFRFAAYAPSNPFGRSRGTI